MSHPTLYHTFPDFLALSGVGGRERRTKREGKEKESAAPVGNDSEAAPASLSIVVPVPPRHGASATDEVELRSSSSLKKERTRRSGRGGGAAGTPPVRISVILQRADTAPAPTAIAQGEHLVSSAVNTIASVVGGSRDGRRGRGRGREREGHT